MTRTLLSCFFLLLMMNGYLFAQQSSGSNTSTSAGTSMFSSADATNKVPITRAAFLQSGSNLLSVIDLYEFTDLVQSNTQGISGDGKFYVTPSEFYALPPVKKMHILQNESTYIIVANASLKPKVILTQAQFQSFSQEKQDAILQSGDYIIQ